MYKQREKKNHTNSGIHSTKIASSGEEKQTNKSKKREKKSEKKLKQEPVCVAKHSPFGTPRRDHGHPSPRRQRGRRRHPRRPRPRRLRLPAVAAGRVPAPHLPLPPRSDPPESLDYFFFTNLFDRRMKWKHCRVVICTFLWWWWILVMFVTRVLFHERFDF